MAGVVYEYHASAVTESVFVGLMDDIVPTKASWGTKAAEDIAGEAGVLG